MKEQIDPNELQIKSKPYKVGFGGSMYIHVMPNGSKYWRMAYRFNEKQKTFAIGTYPDISLFEAEKIRDEAKALIKKGIDPIVMNIKQENSAPVQENDFPKPQANIEQSNFQLSVSGKNQFSIQHNGQALSLNRKQALAVYSFFDSVLEVHP
jgi:hypothetical protein